MHLYHLTLVPSTSVSHAISGSFTGPGRTEIALLSSSSLSLYRVIHPRGQLHPVFSTPLFANARCLARFRLPGDRRDFAVVSSDAGTLAVLKAVEGKGWVAAACEPFGRSGVRRTVPGEYLAVDPKGRAVMVAAVEKSRFVFVLNRDKDEGLTVSSPLVGHKSQFATFCAVGLDVGFDNPMFAVLEKGYDNNARKLLVYYELDLGLNHVVRKYAAEVSDSTFVMAPVPSGSDGPGGVLLCETGMITYRNILTEEEDASPSNLALGSEPNGIESSKTSKFSSIRAALPYRHGTNPRESMIVSAAMFKKKEQFFYIFCTDLGDLIKATLTWNPKTGATALTLRYFDSLPGPACSLLILRTGYLFAAMEAGDHMLLKFKGLGDGYDPAGGYSSSDPMSLYPLLVSAPKQTWSKGPSHTLARPETVSSELAPRLAQSSGPAHRPSQTSSSGNVSSKTHSHSSTETLSAANTEPRMALNSATVENILKANLPFKKREAFKNLASSDICDTISPSVSLAFRNHLTSEASQILVGCGGQASQAQLKILHRGLAVMIIANEAQLSATLRNVFSLKEKSGDLSDKYIVISYLNATKVLLVGESKVTEVTNSPFLEDQPTLAAAQMGSTAMVQVHPAGIRSISDSQNEDWTPPEGCSVLSGCVNSSQIVIALSNGDVLYFEMDSEGSSSIRLRETLSGVLSRVVRAEDGVQPHSQLPSVAISDLPPGRTKSSFFAVADGVSSTTRLYHINSSNSSLSACGLQVAPGPVSSVAIVEFTPESLKLGSGSSRGITLLVGTRTGGLTMSQIDPVTGSISSKRTRILGAKSVTLIPMNIGGVPACIASSTRPMLLHQMPSGIMVSPLHCDVITQASSFSSEQLPDAFVFVHDKTLNIARIDALHAVATAASGHPSFPSLMLTPASAMVSQFSVFSSEVGATPRRIIPLKKDSRNFVVIEAHQQSTTVPKWKSRLRLVSVVAGETNATDDDVVDEDGMEAFQTLDEIRFESSVTATTACVLNLTSATYIAVGIAKNYRVSATAKTERSGSRLASEPSFAINVYEVQEGDAPSHGRAGGTPATHIAQLKLYLFHTTPIQTPVFAMCAFRERILVGIGSTLRLYEIGRKQLLRKGEQREAVPNRISQVCVTGGDRVWVGDIRESVTLYRIDLARREVGAQKVSTFIKIADDTQSRWIVALTALDYSTVAASDKFGNIFILRIPPDVTNAGAAANAVSASLPMAYCKLVVEACIHIGPIVTGLCMCDLRSLSSKYDDIHDCDGSLIYCTLEGGIGVLHPFKVRNEGAALEALEREMRERTLGKSVVGREYLSWRSTFYPVKQVVDGDLCEMWKLVPWHEKTSIAKRLERDIGDIERILLKYRDAIL